MAGASSQAVPRREEGNMFLDTPVWITESAAHFGPPIQRHTEMHWYDLLQGSLRVYSSQLYCSNTEVTKTRKCQ